VEGYRANLKKEFNPGEPVTECIPYWIVEYGAPDALRKWKQQKAQKRDPAKRKAASSSSAQTDSPPEKRPRGRTRKKAPVLEPVLEQQATEPATERPKFAGQAGAAVSRSTDAGHPGATERTQVAQLVIIDLLSDSD